MSETSLAAAGRPASRASPQGLLLAGFATALFLAALLLFWVEPLFAKMVLPLLGGAPAVWTTAMMFFQGALLAGYAYAHLLGRRLPLRWQVMVHLALLALAATLLPLGIDAAWLPPADGSIVLWLLAMMAATLGLPFFVLAASAPLLQHWFARSGHPAAGDPYFLYAASNLGSLAALLGYPLLLEPSLRLAQQSLAWTGGFALLALLVAGCAVAVLRAVPGAPRAARPEPANPHRVDAAPRWRQRLVWVLYGFVPSSLLLGVTGFLTTDLAAGPMLWIIPLALYLLSFVLVFARRAVLPQRWMLAVQPILLLGTAATIAVTPRSGALFLACVLLHLAAFFVTAMICHGELARRRPRPAYLTQFYLLMAVGGLFGGVFNALAAPSLFDTLLEYPLVLVLAGLLRPGRGGMGSLKPADLVLPAALFAIGALPAAIAHIADLPDNPMRNFVLVAAAALVAWRLARSPLRLGLALAAILLTAALPMPGIDVLAQARTFFGTYQVRRNDDAQLMQFMHGSTLHGVQSLREELRREPTTYYARPGPVGQFFATLPRAPRTVAVVGLGAGVMACYRRPGEDWTFYEIDPAVDRLARDPRHFRFLADCAPQAGTVLGDARLALASRPDGALDLLILDAFSSDSVPTHLLTREALALYLRKLAPGGMMLFNISNRHLDLEPVVARQAEALGMAGRANGTTRLEDAPVFAAASRWVVLARSAADLAFLAADPRWTPLAADPRTHVWTDDHADVLGAMVWSLD